MSAALREALLRAADALEQAREELCALDAATGDGDHGMTMAFGARGVRRQLASVAGDDPAQLVRAAALGMAAGGGAIGALYLAGLNAISDELDRSLPAGSRAHSDGALVDLLARCAEGAAVAIIAVGHAQAGNKTVLDALLPLAGALSAAANDHRSLGQAVADACAAVRGGAAATTDMVATVGRSARFGDASRGAPDPGATSFALVIAAMTSFAGARTASPDADGTAR